MRTSGARRDNVKGRRGDVGLRTEEKSSHTETRPGRLPAQGLLELNFSSSSTRDNVT